MGQPLLYVDLLWLLGPSVLARYVFCPPPAVGLCKVTGVRGHISFRELLQFKGLGWAEVTPKVVFAKRILYMRMEEI